MFLVIPLLAGRGVQSRTCRHNIQNIVSRGVGNIVGKAIVFFNSKTVLCTAVLPTVHQHLEWKHEHHHRNATVRHKEGRFEGRLSEHVLRKDRRSNPYEALQQNAAQAEDIASTNFGYRAYLDCSNLAEHDG